MTLPFPSLCAGPEDGPVVLLLHGFPQTKAAWRDVVGLLGDRGYRAVAFDQRGYRPAAGDGAGDYRLDALAGDVFTMADALGADRFHVVGHDWGGAVAWKLAAEPAGRVASAAVVATPHPEAFARSLLGSQAARSLYIAGFQVPLLPEVVLRAANGAVLRRLLVRSGLDRAHADEYTSAMLADGVLGRALGWYRQNVRRSAAAVGPSRVPTLYVWPSDDVALGRRAAERTADHVEAPYRFVVLDGCPHWVPELRPDALAALLVEHLEVNAGRAPLRPPG